MACLGRALPAGLLENVLGESLKVMGVMWLNELMCLAVLKWVR